MRRTEVKDDKVQGGKEQENQKPETRRDVVKCEKERAQWKKQKQQH